MSFLKKLNIELLYDSAINSTSRYIPKRIEVISQSDIYTLYSKQHYSQ
jgi:hypothetical protein